MPPSSYGALIETARKGAHLSVQAAADRAGVAKATWIDNVRGYRRRSGIEELVVPKAETIACMADAVGLSPERLESEGGHPLAAAVLREMRNIASDAAAGRARPQGRAGSMITAEMVARTDRLYMPAIWKRLAALKKQGIEDPAGFELFPDDEGLAGAYEADRMAGHDVDEAAWIAGLVAERRDRLGRAGRGSRHGTGGA